MPNSKVNRKPSFEHDLRGSPSAYDTGSTSSRSDSPAAYFNGLGLVRGHVAPEAPPYSSRSAYSPNSNNADPPPPPPPPRGATPPPPPHPPPPSAAAKANASNGGSGGMQPFPNNVQQMFKRMSPVPNTPPIPGPRGTSPAPALPPGRNQGPLVVQNGPQAQAQLTQQMQALNLYQQSSNSNSPLPPAATATPPPPYPIGSASKLVAPPPPYPSSALPNRASPTLSSPTPKSPAPFPPNQTATSAGSAVRGVPLPAYRQQPIIMQSVKSTQVCSMNWLHGDHRFRIPDCKRMQIKLETCSRSKNQCCRQLWRRQLRLYRPTRLRQFLCGQFRPCLRLLRRCLTPLPVTGRAAARHLLPMRLWPRPVRCRSPALLRRCQAVRLLLSASIRSAYPPPIRRATPPPCKPWPPSGSMEPLPQVPPTPWHFQLTTCPALRLLRHLIHHPW